MSEPTSPSALRFREIGDAEDDDLFILVAGGLQLALHLLEVALAVEHLHAGIVGERGTGEKDADPGLPHLLVGARDRDHVVLLVDRAEKRAPDRRIVEGRHELVHAHDGDGAGRILDRDRDRLVLREQRLEIG